MTPRERELAERHLAMLEDMRDAAWRRAVQPEATVGKRIPEHDALEYAVSAVREKLAAAYTMSIP